MPPKFPLMTRIRKDLAYVTLAVLLGASFLMGGGSRGDILSLVALRPLSIICLAIGLLGLGRDQWRQYRLPFVIVLGIIGLILVHLIPLPPFIWSHLPGRGIAVRADQLAGLEGVWRPITLVPYRGWNSFWSMAAPGAAMVLAAQVNPERQHLVVRVFLLMALVSALLAVMQAVSGHNKLFFLYNITNLDSPVGLFANRNHQAALMCLVLPMLALLAVRAKGNSKNAVQALCGGLSLAVVLLVLAAGSRAGLVFVVVCGGASLLLWRNRPAHRRERTRKKTWLVPAAIAGAALLSTVGLAIIFSRASAIDRVTATDPVEEGRLEVWRTTLHALPHYLPIGSGIGSFVEVFQIWEPSTILGLTYWNHAHNDWLEWIMEGGIPALALLALAIFGWLRLARGLWRELPARRFETQLGTVGAAVIFVLGLWSLVDYPLRVPSLACFAAVAAVWMSMPNAAKQRGGAVYQGFAPASAAGDD